MFGTDLLIIKFSNLGEKWRVIESSKLRGCVGQNKICVGQYSILHDVLYFSVITLTKAKEFIYLFFF